MTPQRATHTVTAYYADDVKPPREPGAVAIQTWHIGEASADIEVAAAESRSDIGRVVKVRLR